MRAQTGVRNECVPPYLHSGVSSLVGHVGGLLRLLDAVDNLVVGLCHINNSVPLSFCNQTEDNNLYC